MLLRGVIEGVAGSGECSTNTSGADSVELGTFFAGVLVRALSPQNGLARLFRGGVVLSFMLGTVFAGVLVESVSTPPLKGFTPL